MLYWIFLGWKQMHLVCPLLFLDNNRQHEPVCAKTIPSWVRKVLGIANAHISKCFPWCCIVCIFWWLVFPWCPSCRQATGLEFLPQPDIIFLLTLLLLIITRIPFNEVSCVSVSNHSVGKSQTITNIKFCKYAGVLGQSSPQYQANCFPIFCAVLAPIAPEGKTPQPNIFFTMFVYVASLS